MANTNKTYNITSIMVPKLLLKVFTYIIKDNTYIFLQLFNIIKYVNIYESSI